MGAGPLGHIGMGVLMIPIVDGSLNHRADFATYVAKFVIGTYAVRRGVRVPTFDHVSVTEALEARIDAGRWIVECPDCHDAQFVWPDDEHPLFMCVTCFNATVEGLWRRVAVPEQRAAIEALLLKRPLPTVRHWRAGETIDELRAENRAHGHEV